MENAWQPRRGAPLDAKAMAFLPGLARFAVEIRRLADGHYRAARRRAAHNYAVRLARLQRQEAARLQGLAESALALNTILAPDAILHVLAERSRALIGAHVAVASLDGDETSPAMTAIAGSHWHIRHASTAAGTARTAGMSALGPLLCPPGAQDGTRRLGHEELLALLSGGAGGQMRGQDVCVPRGWLAAPLLGTDGRRIGLVQLWDKPSSRRRGARDFSAEDEAILAQLAHMASVAAENARLFREAQDAVRVRNEFLATVTHDLRNPLASIRGYAQLLLRQERLSDAPRPLAIRALDTIDATTTRMERLVDELLDVARLRAGQPLSLARSETDLVALARASVEAHQATTRTHTLRLEADDATLSGQWDAARLERVLDNVLSNAIKYSPDGGEIVVSVSPERTPAGIRTAVLRVRDHGIGIPAADLPGVFERFSRGRNAVGRVPGIGIGLAGVRQIVEQHGGTVHVESEERAGSTFTVRLPRAAGVALPAAPVASTRHTVPARHAPAARSPLPPRGRVLIVEDDALTQAVIREALLDEGYEVLAAADGEGALRLIGESAPDLILLDLRLPVMDGPTFAHRYREAVPAPVPIIVVTAMERRALTSPPIPAAAVVSKPFVVDELLQLVNRHAPMQAA